MKKLSCWGLAVGGVLVVSGVLLALNFLTDGVESPLVQAHRGGRAEYDENVLGAFERSLAAGVRGFETDLRLTSDGEIVLSHDETSNRTMTTPDVNLEKSTLAECTALKLKISGENVPSLKQLVELFRGRDDIFVEFELKSLPSDPARLELYCRKCYETVTAAMDKKNFAFTSFIREVLTEMRRLYPDVNLGYIMMELQDAHLDFAKDIKASRVAPSMQSSVAKIKKARAMGFDVTLWMVENKEDWEIARALGVTAITSDHPIALRNAIKGF